MSALSRSFTGETLTQEGVSVAENANAKGIYYRQVFVAWLEASSFTFERCLLLSEGPSTAASSFHLQYSM